MSEVLEILTALSGPLEMLVQLLKQDTYDQEAERQALLSMQRAIHDYRMRKALETSKIP